MATNDQHFDPRFDPAFQRGFGGPAGAGPAAQPGRRSAAPVVQQLPPPTPVAETPPPVGDPAARGAAPAQPGQPAALRDDGLSIADDTAEVRRAWANPFLIGLSVVAVALVAAGLWMFQAARQPFLGTNANSEADYATLSMMMALAPFLLLLGAATAIGIAFHLAADWQRRHR